MFADYTSLLASIHLVPANTMQNLCLQLESISSCHPQSALQTTAHLMHPGKFNSSTVTAVQSYPEDCWKQDRCQAFATWGRHHEDRHNFSSNIQAIVVAGKKVVTSLVVHGVVTQSGR
jgi:hypothetical protein